VDPLAVLAEQAQNLDRPVISGAQPMRHRWVSGTTIRPPRF